MDGATFLPEFDHEFAQTRRSLERIPEDRLDWTPHEKSFSLGELATHLSQIPGWLDIAMNADGFDMGEAHDRDLPETKEEILARFDANLAEARRILKNVSGETLTETWSLTDGDEVVMSMPKAAVLRGFILNHNVHHRAQLGVYLRLLDVPVPAIYGPSADEEA